MRVPNSGVPFGSPIMRPIVYSVSTLAGRCFWNPPSWLQPQIRGKLRACKVLGHQPCNPKPYPPQNYHGLPHYPASILCSPLFRLLKNKKPSASLIKGEPRGCSRWGGNRGTHETSMETQNGPYKGTVLLDWSLSRYHVVVSPN